MKIRNKAMCVLIEDGYMLVGDGNSIKSNVRPVQPGNFYRVLGGGIEGNETPEEAVRRELREEVGIEIENLKFLDTFDNKYVYAGEDNHEIISLFVGDPGTKGMDKNAVIHRVEDTYEFDIVWVPVEEFLNESRVLFPKYDYGRILKV